MTQSFLVLSLVLLLSSCAMAKYRHAAEKCAQLVPGTTQSEVVAAMGSPETQSHPQGDLNTLWLWYSVGGDSAPIVVTLTKVGETYVTNKQGTCGVPNGA